MSRLNISEKVCWSVKPLTEELLKECFPFTCGLDSDMDSFFKKDAIAYTRFKMGVSYCACLDEDPRQIMACFTLANDSLRIYDLPSSRRNMMWGISRHEKMLKRYPGVLLGRLAVSESFARQGIGSQVLGFLKRWYRDFPERAACRFLIVDAKNTPEVLAFYEKNGFEYLFSSEFQEDLYTKPATDEKERELRKKNPRKLATRLMFFDLINL